MFTKSQEKQIRRAALKLAQAKYLAQQVLDEWTSFPDVDASSGQLEHAIEGLGIVERDLDDAADRNGSR